MQIITSLEELRQKAVGYRVVPVAGELFSDVRTPIEVLRILKNVSSHCFLFESVENHFLDLTRRKRLHLQEAKIQEDELKKF